MFGYVNCIFAASTVLIIVSGDRYRRCNGAGGGGSGGRGGGGGGSRSSRGGGGEDTVAKYNALLSAQSPLCAAGSEQSPINLKIEGAIQTMSELIFDPYDGILEGHITNSGTGVLQVNVDGNEPVSISGAAFDGLSYRLRSFQFHWSSEHQIDGKREALEIQLLHIQNDYANFEEAVQNHGIAVVAILYYANKSCESSIYPNMVKDVKAVKEKFMVPVPIKVNVSNFFPTNRGNFYHYSGSLTTPGCTEGVRWVVFEKTNCIEQEKLDTLKSILMVDPMENPPKLKPVLMNYKYSRPNFGGYIFYNSILRH